VSQSIIRPDRTAEARAISLLWSDQVYEISDEEFDEIGRVLGLDEPQQP
jgi:hypothetical protein